MLGWHFVNYICYFIDLMFMPWQCLTVGLRGLGVQFHAKSELQPKVLPSALYQGYHSYGHLDQGADAAVN